jgi:hypothetical protein
MSTVRTTDDTSIIQGPVRTTISFSKEFFVLADAVREFYLRKGVARHKCAAGWPSDFAKNIVAADIERRGGLAGIRTALFCASKHRAKFESWMEEKFDETVKREAAKAAKILDADLAAIEKLMAAEPQLILVENAADEDRRVETIDGVLTKLAEGNWSIKDDVDFAKAEPGEIEARIATIGPVVSSEVFGFVERKLDLEERKIAAQERANEIAEAQLRESEKANAIAARAIHVASDANRFAEEALRFMRRAERSERQGAQTRNIFSSMFPSRAAKRLA